MNILKEICQYKSEHIKIKKQQISLSNLVEQIKQQPIELRDFTEALKAKISQQKTALICEIKRASPSKGLIRQDFDVATIAKSYQQGGASCLSVLTDEKYFQGQDANIMLAKKNCQLPILRKDFIIDPYQI